MLAIECGKWLVPHFIEHSNGFVVSLPRPQSRQTIKEVLCSFLGDGGIACECAETSYGTSHVFDLARKERDAWLQMPARKAANMAAELDVDAHLMEQVLDRYIREHLAEMAEIKFEPATG